MAWRRSRWHDMAQIEHGAEGDARLTAVATHFCARPTRRAKIGLSPERVLHAHNGA